VISGMGFARRDADGLEVDAPCTIFGTLATIMALSAISAGSQVAGSAIAAHASGEAAKTQSDAALRIAQMQTDAAKQASNNYMLALQGGLGRLDAVRGSNDRLAAPYVGLGTDALAQLRALKGLPAGPANTYAPFVAMTRPIARPAGVA
jgi:hypothetical protein